MDAKTIQEKLKKKFGGSGAGRTGKQRRKKKVTRKSNLQDDKRLQTQLKRLNVNNIPAIDEVNLFREDGKVVHFAQPKGLSLCFKKHFFHKNHIPAKFADLYFEKKKFFFRGSKCEILFWEIFGRIKFCCFLKMGSKQM